MKNKKLVLILTILYLLFIFSFRILNNIQYTKNYYLSRRCYQIIEKTIHGSSMSPLLNDGDKVKILINYYACHPLKRNDILAIGFRTQPKKLFAKRLVGLPNDKVEVINNNLYINGRLVTNSINLPYLIDNTGKIRLLKPLINQTIPQGYYLVLSEEQGFSYDSRYFGYIENQHIKGKIIK